MVENTPPQYRELGLEMLSVGGLTNNSLLVKQIQVSCGDACQWANLYTISR